MKGLSAFRSERLTRPVGAALLQLTTAKTFTENLSKFPVYFRYFDQISTLQLLSNIVEGQFRVHYSVNETKCLDYLLS